MAVKKKSTSAMDFVTCTVAFTKSGVKMTFDPQQDGNAVVTKSLTKANYDKFVKLAKKLGKPLGAGGGAIRSGALLSHTQKVSKSRKTKFAFRLQGATSWGFVNEGFRPSTAAAARRFSGTKVSPNQKLVEVTFTPQKIVKNYPYDLWLEAKVTAPGTPPKDRASVTVIVDPVIRPGTVP
jgi:hypothetical protein